MHADEIIAIDMTLSLKQQSTVTQLLPAVSFVFVAMAVAALLLPFAP